MSYAILRESIITRYEIGFQQPSIPDPVFFVRHRKTLKNNKCLDFDIA